MSVNETEADNDSDILISQQYVLWCHDLDSNDWSIESYNKICTIDTVSMFWKIFNNFYKLDTKNDYFLMKKDITPTWEDTANRDGGICSIRIDIINAYELWEELCTYMICDQLTDDSNDVNGISFCPKYNWAMIKINDLSKTFPKDILKKYKYPSIKYKINIPEN
jgi:hypothetical protein